MAVNIDRVYQKVLALANKEQRGYITPQEFNLFADQAQLEIFEQYFYDLEQRQRATGNEAEYIDIVTNIQEKISLFEMDIVELTVDWSNSCVIPEDVYRLGLVRVDYSDDTSIAWRTCEKLEVEELKIYSDSPLTHQDNKFSYYYKRWTDNSGANKIRCYPRPQTGQDRVYVSYIKKPTRPSWTYVVSGGGHALYNPTASDLQHFQLHASEESNLVIKILQLAGVNIKDYNLVQVAAASEAKRIQQEKQ